MASRVGVAQRASRVGVAHRVGVAWRAWLALAGSAWRGGRGGRSLACRALASVAGGAWRVGRGELCGQAGHAREERGDTSERRRWACWRRGCWRRAGASTCSGGGGGGDQQAGRRTCRSRHAFVNANGNGKGGRRTGGGGNGEGEGEGDGEGDGGRAGARARERGAGGCGAGRIRRSDFDLRGENLSPVSAEGGRAERITRAELRRRRLVAGVAARVGLLGSASCGVPRVPEDYL